MKEHCPKCDAALTLAEVEGWSPLVRKGYAFACPNCGSQLIINYWHGKANLVRLLFVAGAVVLMLGLPKAGMSMWTTYIIVVGYVLGAWITLRKIREIVVL